ncbi:MAG: hypothetical protein M3273_01365 [Actinomycetota bacterium]|nr:hypothetical protein [Actinomycetota bacterium]
MSTTRLTTRWVIGAFFVILAAVAAVLLLDGSDAKAAPECCETSYSADGKTMTITGYVSYRGELLYMSVGGKKCLAKAGDQRAYIKSTIATKFMPNGRHEISIVSKVKGEVRYSTQYFTITDSPAVFVEVKAPEDKVVKTSSPTIGLDQRGAVKSRVCKLDGSAVGCAGSRFKLPELGDGPHVFQVTVKGTDGFSSSDKKSFTIDTKPPTAPEVVGGDGEWANETVDLRAKGSTDEGTGLRGYEWQRSTDGGATWGRVQKTDGVFVDREGETHFRFRAVDRIGRASEWVEAVTRIDWSVPEGQPAVTVTSGDPCTGTYPVTLTASGGTDSVSGVAGYHFSIYEQHDDGTSADRGEYGTSITLASPATYHVLVWIVDGVGHESYEATQWSTFDVCA